MYKRQGQGAGSDPEVGRKSAEESRNQIAKALEDTDMVFIDVYKRQVVPLDAPFTVIIDYAHTPDGLKNILSTVCGFADGRVIALFGCGDVYKRQGQRRKC